MIAVDTNILVYAHRDEFAQHKRANEVINGLATGRVPWGIPWPCIGEFVSVVTNPRPFRRPSTVDEAALQLDVWVHAPSARLLGERVDTWQHLRELLVTSGVTRASVHDARIAAICLEHGVHELWSADRDFSRFPKLRTRNPLEDELT
ncbi:MAG TPA: TA system VapC family ribonuclease toxin [Pseudonocardiaceae bacterium]|nr:TA system VapC family ribonuclease toxin [Pseudonocardiaceae bacterium]